MRKVQLTTCAAISPISVESKSPKNYVYFWALEIIKQIKRKAEIEKSKRIRAEMSTPIDAWAKKYSKGFRYIGPDTGAPTSTRASRTLRSLKKKKKSCASPRVNPNVDWSEDDWNKLFRLLQEEHANVLKLESKSSGASLFASINLKKPLCFILQRFTTKDV